jgi:hypothetical protein
VLKKACLSKEMGPARGPICVVRGSMTGNVVTGADRVYRLEKL